MKKRIMIVTRKNQRMFGYAYEADENSSLPFSDYSNNTLQDFRELEKFKKELGFEENYIERWAVVKEGEYNDIKA